MASPAQSLASAMRLYFRRAASNGLVTPSLRSRSHEFLCRVLSGEMPASPRLPAHTYLHGVIRNRRAYLGLMVAGTLDAIAKAGVQIHPTTFRHLVRSSIEEDIATDSGFLQNHDPPPSQPESAASLLFLAGQHQIPHPLSLYGDLVKLYLDAHWLFPAIKTYSLLIGFLIRSNTKLEDSHILVTPVTWTTERATEAAKVQKLLSEYLSKRLDKIKDAYDGNRTTEATDTQPVHKMPAVTVRQTFQAIVWMIQLALETQSHCPYALLHLLEKAHVPEAFTTDSKLKIDHWNGTVVVKWPIVDSIAGERVPFRQYVDKVKHRLLSDQSDSPLPGYPEWKLLQILREPVVDKNQRTAKGS